MYYEINETAARIAHDNMSMFEYRPGTATSQYRSMVDQAAAICADVTAKCKTESQRDRAAYLLDRYACKLAQAINRENEIGTRCPSVLVAGPANFPVRKKQKQVAAWDANRENFKAADHYLSLLRTVHLTPISSSDPEVISCLRHKLQSLEANHQRMKSANAYYRTHKTLDGCPGITEKEREYLLRPGVFARGDGSPLALYRQPFPSYELQNSLANIHRTRERLQSLETVKAAPAADIKTDAYTYKEDAAAMRVQFFFDGKPDVETRSFLKSSGFRWAPSVGAWQRQLTPAGQAAARAVMDFLDK